MRLFDLTPFGLEKLDAFSFKRIRGREIFAVVGRRGDKFILLVLSSQPNVENLSLLIEREFESKGEIVQIFLE